MQKLSWSTKAKWIYCDYPNDTESEFIKKIEKVFQEKNVAGYEIPLRISIVCTPR